MEWHPYSVTYENRVYCLKHLHPQNFDISLSGGIKIPAFIIFSSHCYTDSYPPIGKESLIIKDYNNNVRYFCTKRYNLSTQLKSWFLSWSGIDCYQSQDNRKGNINWVVVETANGEHIKVAFTVKPNRKNPTGVMVTVKTVHAYEWTKAPNSAHPYLPFDVLVKGIGLSRKCPTVRKRSGP